MNSFDKIAEYYDTLYYKSEIYEREAMYVQKILEQHQIAESKRILDVACGTGAHMRFFLLKYEIYGLDSSETMLNIAKSNYPKVQFYHADMVDFRLDKQFGVILCLYGSIGFVQTQERLVDAIQSFANHLESGGILILVPWSTQEDFQEALVTDRVKTEEVQIVRIEHVKRMTETQVEITYHYLLGDNHNKRIQYIAGTHPPIGLFFKKDYQEAIAQANLELIGTYIGKNIQMGMAYICRK